VARACKPRALGASINQTRMCGNIPTVVFALCVAVRVSVFSLFVAMIWRSKALYSQRSKYYLPPGCFSEKIKAMPTRKAPMRKEPTLAADRALRAITQQLDSLQKLKDRRFDEAEAEETEWEHFTQSVIETAFGDPSSELTKFFRARNAGQHNLRGVSPGQRQINFQMRIKEQEALLRSLVSTLRLQLPEEEIKGVYEPGDEYAFYRDLTSLIQTAVRDVLIVDAYLDQKVFNLYVSKVPTGTPARILSKRIGNNVETVARMYVKSRPLELRSSADIHDRAVFLDQRGWVIGQSIKDAASQKPTYMIELNEPLLTPSSDAYNRIWAAATVVI
jgi:hypothetical protein